MVLLARTTNGGINWSFLYDTYTTNYEYITFFGNSTGYVGGVGYDGTLLAKTTDCGANWTRLSSIPVSRDVIFMKVFSTNKILYLGSTTTSGTCMQSIDGGYSWLNINVDSLPGELSSASFVGQESIITVTREGSVLRSNDCGVHWINVFQNNNLGLHSISFKDSTNGIICGSYGELLKSTNGGMNWFHLSSNVTLEIEQKLLY